MKVYFSVMGYADYNRRFYKKVHIFPVYVHPFNKAVIREPEADWSIVDLIVRMRSRCDKSNVIYCVLLQTSKPDDFEFADMSNHQLRSYGYRLSQDYAIPFWAFISYI